MNEDQQNYLLLRDSLWVVIGLCDVLMAGETRGDDEKALLMRTRGDLLGLLHVVRRAESKLLNATRSPSPDPAA